jgi:hypothetical protein
MEVFLLRLIIAIYVTQHILHNNTGLREEIIELLNVSFSPSSCNCLLEQCFITTGTRRQFLFGNQFETRKECKNG